MISSSPCRPAARLPSSTKSRRPHRAHPTKLRRKEPPSRHVVPYEGTPHGSAPGFGAPRPPPARPRPTHPLGVLRAHTAPAHHAASRETSAAHRVALCADGGVAKRNHAPPPPPRAHRAEWGQLGFLRGGGVARSYGLPLGAAGTVGLLGLVGLTQHPGGALRTNGGHPGII